MAKTHNDKNQKITIGHVKLSININQSCKN